MQRFSLHTHTSGFDGRNTEEEMLQKARELGLTHIGFSNHFIVHPKIKEAPMYQYAIKGNYQNIYSSSFDEVIEKFATHYAKIDQLRKNSDIKILKGMEVDFFSYPEWRENFKKAINILHPDYLIGAAHFVEHNGVLCNSHDLKVAPKIEQKQMLHRYWQNERAAAESGLFTILAHLDLMKKTGLGQESEWIEDENKTIEVIKKAGCIVELNTSYYKFGKEPYPGIRIMQKLAKENIPVVLSDDAHSAEQLSNFFERATDLAKECGVSYFVKPFEKNQKKSNFSLAKNSWKNSLSFTSK